MSIDQRLAEIGLTLPQPAAPVASYVPAVDHGGLLHISGQISFAEDGSLIKGRLGEDMELDAGQAAARRCGIMLLAQIKAALGSLDRVERIVKLGAFVNSTAGFIDQKESLMEHAPLVVAITLSQYLQRIALYEDRLNAIITVNPKALDAALGFTAGVMIAAPTAWRARNATSVQTSSAYPQARLAAVNTVMPSPDPRSIR